MQIGSLSPESKISAEYELVESFDLSVNKIQTCHVNSNTKPVMLLQLADPSLVETKPSAIETDPFEIETNPSIEETRSPVDGITIDDTWAPGLEVGPIIREGPTRCWECCNWRPQGRRWVRICRLCCR
nr:MAG: hypothetical protein EDM05_27515 [Leptolyngbya sp. IPPAS B-1204]